MHPQPHIHPSRFCSASLDEIYCRVLFRPASKRKSLSTCLPALPNSYTMAAIGEAASILTIAQSAKQLYDFMKSIEDAPTYILDIVEDARVLRTIVEQIGYDEDASQMQLASAVDVLALCKLKMQKIELLLEDLGLQTLSKKRRRWGSIKAVLHKEEIEALRKSLESAKSTLVMARAVFAE